ncbi:UbiH/UbiF/VisC/COQ6 family ubiquinone biosynthesis hydroxylase [Alcanivorax quisquiliarum]|uniref:UbiH/UbiF/VisC/COQ6 family ubiquinone biosynthesis hydroxylase n=1 Tax=Alcanivorax quisquiliarum TaxID=2933565 RepID=A0ABT0E5G5_9GAMM|nr:UbiH/UbiF/VisC/COQ6 family ubiquinone biosynthesis hydroxylase [Alcanivorax quisquiliarum]MCK0537070.1 UbiH/UbiF/VisC/COQ6 family ubiquinone biosynthesis hydroxylase [Alcanivorax quisquiliarum]
MATESVDLVIIGGGMAGGLLAAILAGGPLRVQLVDAAPVPQMPQGLARPRVSALTEASQRMLVRTGAWAKLPPERVQSYTRMQVWDGDGTGEVVFDAVEAGVPSLGWIVENDAVVAALHQALATATNVRWHCDARVTRLQRSAAGWQIALADGRELAAPMLVGADGARSSVRENAGIPGTLRPTGHLAIVGTVAMERPHGRCARQRFMDTGPLALLPLGGDRHHCSLVWSCLPAEAERLMALEGDAFDVALTQASQGCCGALRLLGKRGLFPINELHASEYVSDGVALIGDAAHVVHPLAGQGINMGMLDAAVLAEEFERASTRGLPFYHQSALARYQRRRRGHNALMLNVLHGFKVLFEQPSLEVRLMRNLGMNLFNRAAPVKRMLTRHALGRSGDLPALARRN